MLKKIFCAIVTAVIVFVGATAYAEEVRIPFQYFHGDCYVLTETFVNRTQYRDNRAFSVDVKFVGATVAVHNYSFRENDGLIWFNIDGGTDSIADNDELAKNVWEFGLKFLGIDYEVRYD